jgi:hypothetical protein
MLDRLPINFNLLTVSRTLIATQRASRRRRSWLRTLIAWLS